MSEELNIEPIKLKLWKWSDWCREGDFDAADGVEALAVAKSLLVEIERLRAALGSRGAHKEHDWVRRARLELTNVILTMIYTANIPTPECMRLEEEIDDLANEVLPKLFLAALRGVGTPQEKEL